VADGTRHRRNRGRGPEAGRRQAHTEEHPLDGVEGRRDVRRPREVANDDVGAERAHGVGTVVVVVHQRPYGHATLT